MNALKIIKQALFFMMLHFAAGALAVAWVQGRLESTDKISVYILGPVLLLLDVLIAMGLIRRAGSTETHSWWGYSRGYAAVLLICCGLGFVAGCFLLKL